MIPDVVYIQEMHKVHDLCYSVKHSGRMVPPDNPKGDSR